MELLGGFDEHPVKAARQAIEVMSNTFARGIIGLNFVYAFSFATTILLEGAFAQPFLGAESMLFLSKFVF